MNAVYYKVVKKNEKKLRIMKHNKKSRIQSLERGFEILKCFSSKLGISKATIFRYISTLKDLGYLRKDDEFKGYKLTVKVLDLGFTALNSS